MYTGHTLTEERNKMKAKGKFFKIRICKSCDHEVSDTHYYLNSSCCVECGAVGSGSFYPVDSCSKRWVVTKKATGMLWWKQPEKGYWEYTEKHSEEDHTALLTPASAGTIGVGSPNFAVQCAAISII